MNDPEEGGLDELEQDLQHLKMLQKSQEQHTELEEKPSPTVNSLRDLARRLRVRLKRKPWDEGK